MFVDERARGKPVYFCDVIVHRSSPALSFWDLKGGAWAYNDPCSLSGHGGLAAKLGSPEAIGTFFEQTIRSGSHPSSVRLVAEGRAAVATIDSNVLNILLEQTPALREEVRVLESWGPYPLQPVVVRTDLDPALKVALRESLLKVEADPHTRLELEAFGLKRFVAVDEEDYDAGRLPRPSPGTLRWDSRRHYSSECVARWVLRSSPTGLMLYRRKEWPCLGSGPERRPQNDLLHRLRRRTPVSSEVERERVLVELDVRGSVCPGPTGGHLGGTQGSPCGGQAGRDHGLSPRPADHPSAGRAEGMLLADNRGRRRDLPDGDSERGVDHGGKQPEALDAMRPRTPPTIRRWPRCRSW